MTKPQVTKLSFAIFALTLLVVGYFKLATPLLTVLFSYFALKHFTVRRHKWLAVVFFLIVVSLIFYGFIYFIKHSLTTFPQVAGKSIPIIMNYATSHGIDLPFSDINSLKSQVVNAISDELQSVARFAQVATEEFVFLIIGLVVAISFFLNKAFDLQAGEYVNNNNLYTSLCEELRLRLSRFFSAFNTVMGAQFVISAINTICTAVLVYLLRLPHAELLIIITFLCGLLPIIGNVISNTIICSIAITISSTDAIVTLVFLILIHKLEYFLNSKIIGSRIKNPMWLTLLSLIVGERIMGVPGMILAPVILNYIKLECLEIDVS